MKRIRYTIIFSAPLFPYSNVLEYLAPQLGQTFAGAYCQPIDGIWSEEGHLYQDQYDKVVQESGMQIKVCVLPEQSTRAYQQIKAMLQSLIKDLALNINWVHVESEEVEGKHFSLLDEIE